MKFNDLKVGDRFTASVNDWFTGEKIVYEKTLPVDAGNSMYPRNCVVVKGVRQWADTFEGKDVGMFYGHENVELVEKPVITIPTSVFSKQEQMLIEVAKSSGIELNVDVDSMTYAPIYAKFDNIIGCLVYDGKTLQFGGARCNPADEFDDKFGRGLAFGRAILGEQ